MNIVTRGGYQKPDYLTQGIGIVVSFIFAGQFLEFFDAPAAGLVVEESGIPGEPGVQHFQELRPLHGQKGLRLSRQGGGAGLKHLREGYYPIKERVERRFPRLSQNFCMGVASLDGPFLDLQKFNKGFKIPGIPLF